MSKFVRIDNAGDTSAASLFNLDFVARIELSVVEHNKTLPANHRFHINFISGDGVTVSCLYFANREEAHGWVFEHLAIVL